MRILMLILMAVVAAAAVAVAEEVVDAKQIYGKRCALCHGADGKGDGPAGAALTPPPTNFTEPDYWQTTNAEEIRNAIRKGKRGTAMVPFRGALSTKQIDTLVAYLKGFAPE